jgi:fatty acid-binding protein 3
MSFVGKYERVSAENYDEFLKALNVGFLLRKAATVSTPVMTVSKRIAPDKRLKVQIFINVHAWFQVSEADGKWTIQTATTLKTMELTFELGKEFEETTPDGRQVKALVTQVCDVHSKHF